MGHGLVMYQGDTHQKGHRLSMMGPGSGDEVPLLLILLTTLKNPVPPDGGEEDEGHGPGLTRHGRCAQCCTPKW